MTFWTGKNTGTIIQKTFCHFFRKIQTNISWVLEHETQATFIQLRTNVWKSLNGVGYSLKGIVGASSNVLGKNKAFLKLKYLLWELSERLFFQLYIVVRNLEKSKTDSFLENIITSTFKCIKPNCWYFFPLKYTVISTYPKIT